MDILLREIDTATARSSAQDGSVQGGSYQDREVSAKNLSIGSSKGADIQLYGKEIALKHLVIVASGGKVKFECKNKRKIELNGRAASKGALAINDEIQLESHRIKIIAAPAGFDLALEIRVDQKLQDRALESAYITTIDEASWGTRGPAYVLSFLLLVAFALWPLYSHYHNTHSDNASAPESQILGNAKADIAFIHSGDRYWSTGSLTQAHRLSVGDNCTACHQSPFQQVKDEACEECHQISDHIDKSSTLISVASHAKNSAQACQSCHKEHSEPSAIVITSDMLCVDCHAEEVRNNSENPHAANSIGLDDSMSTGSNIPKTTGFTLGSHPQFKLSYLESVKLDSSEQEKAIVNMRWNKQQMSFDSGYAESSNLKFDHKVHFNASKMRSTDKPEGMQCVDCHTLKSDNEHFEAVNMEKHCASCHQLTFDTDNLERQLPHGKPDEVIRMLEEHYVRVYTDPDYKPAGSGNRRRRLGGSDSSNCDSPFECGMQKAASEAEAQFTKGVCNYCHQVSDAESENLYQRWKVLPVRINDDWYPHAIFDHASHETKKGDSDHSCLSCHDAKQSEVSTDVLIPGIDNCVECHGDVSVANKISVNCVSCHAYHPQALPMDDVSKAHARQQP